jgi:hypothetical protein
VPQDVGIVSHPEVDILIPIHIPDFGALRFLNKEWIRREVVDVMGDPSRHDLSGPFEKFLRTRCFESIGIRKMFHL